MHEGLNVKGLVKVFVRRFDKEKGVYKDWELVSESENLLTNAGRDFLHTQAYATSGIGSNGANYIALSSDSSSPSASDTSLAGEITSGGLERAQGTVTHNSGTSTTTIEHTFTATSSHSSVQKSGLFTASSGGTLVHENTFTPVNLEANDQLKVTWTITLS